MLGPPAGLESGDSFTYRSPPQAKHEETGGRREGRRASSPLFKTNTQPWRVGNKARGRRWEEAGGRREEEKEEEETRPQSSIQNEYPAEEGWKKNMFSYSLCLVLNSWDSMVPWLSLTIIFMLASLIPKNTPLPNLASSFYVYPLVLEHEIHNSFAKLR